MPEPTERCPAAPAGQSHRWKLPRQGEPGPARCRYCGAEKAFPLGEAPNRWDVRNKESPRRGQQAGNRAKAAKREQQP